MSLSQKTIKHICKVNKLQYGNKQTTSTVFPPGGNNTSRSLMFLSLKLDIGGLDPQSSITLPLGITINHLAKVITTTENMQELLKNSNIKIRAKYITHHNLSIVSQSIGS